MVALPLTKLAYIGVKQLAKPIARQIKNGASRSPFFRKYICMPPAQCKYFSQIEVVRCCNSCTCNLMLNTISSF